MPKQIFETIVLVVLAKGGLFDRIVYFPPGGSCFFTESTSFFLGRIMGGDYFNSFAYIYFQGFRALFYLKRKGKNEDEGEWF